MSKAQAVTAENVDDLTDEQMDEALAEMQGQEPAEEGEPTGEQQPVEKPTEQQAAEPEEGKKPDPEPDDVDDKAESVPFKRYDYERNRRRDIERQREDENARWQKRFDELLARQPKPAEPEQVRPQVPDENDPLARVNYVFDQMQRIQQESAEQKAERERVEQEEAQYKEAFNQVNADFERANQADPTIAEAYNALQKSQGEELLAMGYTIPQAQQILRDTERQHVQFVAARGLDIAQYVKSLATARGWRPGDAQQQPAPTANAARATVDVAEAQKRAKSLSNGGGSPGVSDRPSAEQLLNMSDKDFDAFVEKYGMNAVLQG